VGTHDVLVSIEETGLPYIKGLYVWRRQSRFRRGLGSK